MGVEEDPGFAGRMANIELEARERDGSEVLQHPCRMDLRLPNFFSAASG